MKCLKMLNTGTGSTLCQLPHAHLGMCSETLPETETLLSIAFFGIRAVRRQVIEIQRFSEFSVAYKTAMALEPADEFPAEQSYEAWLAAFRSWDDLGVEAEMLEGLEGVQPLALPGGDGSVPSEDGEHAMTNEVSSMVNEGGPASDD